MIIRILPPTEWLRLRGEDLTFLRQVPADDATVIVVEEGQRIVASMHVVRATHIEGAWIDPEFRNAGVTRGLCRKAWDEARKTGVRWAFTGAADDRMRGILERLGAK